MKQEDKKILLKDLCQRLPYGVKVLDNSHKNYGTSKLINIGIDGSMLIDNEINDVQYYPIIDEVKPYLRPMSSMTEEEKDEMFGICTLSNCSVNTDWELVGVEIMSSHPRYGDHYSTDYSAIDWLNKNMFDYRGLISKGLALEAPEGMY